MISVLAAFSATGAASAFVGFVIGSAHGHSKGSELGWNAAGDFHRALGQQRSKKDLQDLADILPAALAPCGVQAPLFGFSFSWDAADALGSDPFHDEQHACALGERHRNLIAEQTASNGGK